MAANLEQAVIEKLRELPTEKQQEVLDFVESLSKETESSMDASEQPLKSIWRVIEEGVKRVPEEAWDHVPADGAEQHDHYLYGSPKK